jgi:hypothetical protein
VADLSTYALGLWGLLGRRKRIPSGVVGRSYGVVIGLGMEDEVRREAAVENSDKMTSLCTVAFYD